MQNIQEINWWLEIAKIAVPSLITLVIGFWLARKTENYKNDFSVDLKSFESVLSRRLEDYKKDINKELENHKIELQSDFQTRLYQFQTKYALFHKEKAETIRILYSYFWDIFILTENINLGSDRETNLTKLREKRLETEIYFSKNRIFFDDKLTSDLDKFLTEIHKITLFWANKDNHNKKDKDNYEKFREFAKTELLVRLKEDFRQLLSAEYQNYQLEK